MRKILVVLLLIVALIPAAFAEQFDFSSMTDEELVAMRDAINAELDARNPNKVKYPAWSNSLLGVYVPDPVPILGREVTYNKNLYGSFNNFFMIHFDDCTQEEYEAYVEVVKEYGFLDVTKEMGNWYEAYNDEGVLARIVYIAGGIDVRYDAPNE